MTRVTVRAAAMDDVRAFYPEVSTSFRAWVAEVDGEVQGIVGIALTHPVACAFAHIREPLRPCLKHPAVMRIVKKVQAVAAASRMPVRTFEEPGEPKARRMLERFGFRYIGTESGNKVFEYAGSVK